MAIDIYSTRAQLAAIEQQPREYSFLYDTFCKEMGCVEDDKAIWDFRKGDRRMAPIVVDGAGGVLMDRGGYETRQIDFCTIAPERVIENNDLQGRAFGEKILGAMTPEQREKKMLIRDQLEMRQAIQRRREWMARQVLLTGKLSVFRYTNEGRDLKTTMVADYGFTNNFTPATAWNQPGAKISYDMEQMFDLVYEGLGMVDTIVVSSDVADIMMSDEKFMKLYDGRNVDMGTLRTRYQGQGVRYLGTNKDNVDMYSFAGVFVDDEGKTQKCLPKGTVIAGGGGVLRTWHGPVTQVEDYGQNAQHKTYIKKEVPLRYGSIESNAIKNRITSRPTIVPANVDAWVVANVL